ncbi:MAG: glycosyltransferase family 39 protein [Pirellulales bacterium]
MQPLRMRLEVRRPLIVVATALVVFFTMLGRPYLWDEDEPKNAECAREMYEAGNWSVPQFNYDLRTDKPILLYWLMLAAYHVGGVSEFTARFWSALLAVGTTLLTYHLGRRLYDSRVGLWSGLAMATCLMFAVSGRAATPDSTLIFCITLTLYLFVRFGGVSASPEGFRLERGGYVAMYAAMGLAVLAKGPVGVVLPGGILGLFLLCRKQQECEGVIFDPVTLAARPWYRRAAANIAQAFMPRRFVAATFELKPLMLLAVVGLVALPWYVTVGIKTNGDWIAGFLGKHNVARFTGSMEGHGGPIVYYLFAILVGFFPWSTLLPIGIYRLVIRLREGAANPHRPADTFLACWAGLYVGFFSLASTKLPSYVLPAYPALAIITGKLIVERLQAPSLVPRTWFRWALYTPAIVGVGICVGLPIVAMYLLPGDAWLGAIGVVLIAGSGVLVYFARREQSQRIMAAYAAMSLVFTVGLVAGVGSRISMHTTSSQIVSEARELRGEQTTLVAFRHYEPTLVYYARGHVPSVGTADELTAWLEKHPNSCIVTRDEHLLALEAALDTKPQIAARHKRFLRRRGEIVLVTPPPVTVAAESSPVRR